MRIAIEQNPKLKACDEEFNLPIPSYTINTLTYLKEKYLDSAYPDIEVFQENIYDNIDLLLYSRNKQLKYDIIIQPFAQTKNIKIKFFIIKNIRLSNGNLIIQNSFNSTTELAPYAYQVFGSDTVEV